MFDVNIVGRNVPPGRFWFAAPRAAVILFSHLKAVVPPKKPSYYIMIFEKMKRKHIIFNYPTYTHASYKLQCLHFFVMNKIN